MPNSVLSYRTETDCDRHMTGEAHRVSDHALGITMCGTNSDLASRSAGHVEICCHDHASFRSHTNAELNALCDLLVPARTRVEARTMTKVRLERLELVNGLNTNPLGMLFDSTLRQHMNLLACFRFDWLHNMLQDGDVVRCSTSFTHADRME